MDAPIHAYVALGENGLIKIGQTRNPQKRLPGLRKGFKSQGDKLSRVEFLPGIPCGRAVENVLIYELRRSAVRHGGREWFTGISFNSVLEIATQSWHENKDRKAYVCPFTKEQLAEREVARKARCQEARERGRLRREAKAAKEAAGLARHSPGRCGRAETVFAWMAAAAVRATEPEQKEVA